MESVANLQAIEVLNLYKCPEVTVAGIMHLKKNQSLKRLVLPPRAYKESDIRRMSEELKPRDLVQD